MIRLSDKGQGLRVLRVSGNHSLVDESLMLLARRNCTKELTTLDVRGTPAKSAAETEQHTATKRTSGEMNQLKVLRVEGFVFWV